MGIYIKGMKMPSCCMFCPISNASGCGMMNPPVLMTSKEMLADRPDWCPLVPIPPHGDLIDRDALSNTIEQHYKHLKINRYDRDLLLHYLDVEMAPAIIPAEEVYSQFTDTAGNFHWCGTHSGEHTIKAKEGET